jgi:two-component system sensor histidine kinase/response regulator
MNDESKPLILIVDDVARNLQVLGAILYEKGYEIAMADNGRTALSMLEANRPDLILLDIMMPEMDGYEVCTKIKADEKTKDLPVIFLTAKNETENIVKGFELGAIDYITKPFNSSELLARVETHVELQQSREKIARYNRELEELLRMKSEFLGMAVHDMKNPLNSIIGFTNFAAKDLEESDIAESRLGRSLRRHLGSISDTANYMYKSINQMLENETLESGRLKLDKACHDIGKILNTVLQINKIHARSKNIDIYTNTIGECYAVADEDRMREIMDNLVSNAIKYSPRGKKIWITMGLKGDKVRCSVRDEGPGLTDEDKAKVFERFGKLSAQPTAGESSSGLGLSIVKKLIDMHSGVVDVVSDEGAGADFYFEIEPAEDHIEKMSPFDTDDYKPFGEVIAQEDAPAAENMLMEKIESISPADYNHREDFERIKYKLNKDMMKQWTRVNSTNVINDIRNFALRARETGNNSGIEILSEYGDELNEQAISFDIEKIPSTLALFPVITRRITGGN